MVKLRPNDRNIWTQQITTLLGATCCTRLITLLRRVETHPTSRDKSQQGGQTYATCCTQQCCDMLRLKLRSFGRGLTLWWTSIHHREYRTAKYQTRSCRLYVSHRSHQCNGLLNVGHIVSNKIPVKVKSELIFPSTLFPEWDFTTRKENDLWDG